jgi:hypothetical protein
VSFITFIINGLRKTIKEQVLEKKVEGIPMERGINITHLMFVDDIIIFENGNIVEWNAYKKIMELFCKETGMDFSSKKSSLLEVAWAAEDLALLKDFMPFDVKPVDEGFNYLGCFLKPNYYNKTD